ncbi:CDP-diacylglycerol--glycerol-3-phosphate 3-phosphatidyltransferase [Virgibacillus halodenitrificans]|jgi:CDP-diacylglycerol---glycerol-3-phosphate 3-phosphatidyltransferase|uniref:CDP-diacylglycerol--glycerol-3-phosphate 3-phosphatidyltransferase n=1 Tax=Virgibacillus halodenitrificans TaxID=1482 RepID=A0ABR7VQQ4_VIRHA|nr:CDP-diacylglycerol--glycerol-3-phosphate 3-phosphatidyltransferase [Virgibacillus halodenitrificans]MBD1224234.1 CDP-diacylglycerol--glycerol-3-phosphate 3-phosphatidyltransferase [Virgibacillus halodenitrificans]MCJ0931137.1 CDP-diacylglycerol--glycerol-3-phosphate 3-phosphatidyltransferase [Virgibacillus halodenitrificans]WHX27230.1 CDP-diacylglycerol--glycerol-3-phosphate 3-phosphatidyltransferase [Virgibacillus halodenitrificans]CDQ35776.1 CDP-diacylglycerol--glycerol-3-phosphate 3-phosp
MNIPNRITISRILLIPIFILLLSLPLNWGNWQIGESTLPIADFAAAILFIFASVTDWVDGFYARKYNLVTNLGKFLDPLADKLLVSAALILLVEMGFAPAWVVIIIISREFAVTGLRLVAAGEGFVLAAGSMGKLKTATQMIAIAALLLHNFPFSYIGFPFGTLMLYVALFFTIVSGVDYFIKNWHVMRDSK